MNKILYKLLSILFCCAVFAFTACERDASITESQIDTTPPILNDLDVWLRENFVDPYNIEIQYKWDINDTDVDRFLHPPFQSSVRPVAEVLKSVWIEPYTQLGGENFIKHIAPREFVLAGGFNFNPGGNTITLGIAEEGARIIIFNIDFLDFTNIVYEEDTPNDFDVQFSVTGPLSTIHHEYGHILNQIEPYDPVFDLVNPANYTSSWADRSNEEARELGYISAYASSEPSEDFVEMIQYMLVRSAAQWDDLVNGISSEQARLSIRRKEQLVVEYYQEKFNIDFYELRELTYQALLEI
ncbi:substrate import-associated zinc metallohydrolase lipoprotein [Hyunsoonleella rubra]|uniref:Substrate import-associated zinc metallohydrolase lipoprotein n=1 Tax=Hyunsoonleella rubra TaxID=1737062 RepID=A0ABW5TBD4_9FLAO